MNPFRAAYSWLVKPTYETPDADDVVELASYIAFQQADELTQLLNNTGIVATTYGNSGFGESYGDLNLGSQYGVLGYRVMVRGKDLAKAREVLADYEEELRKRARS